MMSVTMYRVVAVAAGLAWSLAVSASAMADESACSRFLRDFGSR